MRQTALAPPPGAPAVVFICGRLPCLDGRPSHNMPEISRAGANAATWQNGMVTTTKKSLATPGTLPFHRAPRANRVSICHLLYLQTDTREMFQIDGVVVEGSRTLLRLARDPYFTVVTQAMLDDPATATLRGVALDQTLDLGLWYENARPGRWFRGPAQRSFRIVTVDVDETRAEATWHAADWGVCNTATCGLPARIETREVSCIRNYDAACIVPDDVCAARSSSPFSTSRDCPATAGCGVSRYITMNEEVSARLKFAEIEVFEQGVEPSSPNHDNLSDNDIPLVSGVQADWSFVSNSVGFATTNPDVSFLNNGEYSGTVTGG